MKTSLANYLSPQASQSLALEKLQRARTKSTLTGPQTDAELLAFVRKAWGITIPDVQVCDEHSTPARAFCDAYFARSPVSVWMASRGFGGKSMLLSLLALTEAVALHADVNILGGSGQQSQRVLEYMTKFWAHDKAPRHLLASEPGRYETRLTGGTKIQALMASQRSVRGPHPQRLRLDEIDEMDLGILDAAMGQTLSINGVTAQTVMSSTRQYVDGTMTEMLKRAGEKGWSVHAWCYKESMQPHGWLSPADVEQKQSEVTSAMWNSEFELQEPSPDSRAILAEAVEAMFDKTLGEKTGNLHEYCEFEQPVPGATYSTGADWARKKDFTEIITFRTDVRPIRLVAFERTGRLAWPVMVDRYNLRVLRYPRAAHHDGTGIGDVVADFLTVPAEGVVMVGRARADMLTNYIAAIEHNEIVSPLIHSLKSEYLYASMEDVYGSGDGHLPDGIAAGALAWMGVGQGWTDDEMDRYAKNEINPDNLPEWMIKAMKDNGVDPKRWGGA